MDLDVEFALMMRAMAYRGLDDMTFLHCSMRDDRLAKKSQFLINIAKPRPFWATTSMDVTSVDVEGVPDMPNVQPNSQWWIHRDIYHLRPDLRCILHVHTAETIAVAALGKIRQVHQGAALFTPDFMATMKYKGLNRYDGLTELVTMDRYVILMEGHGAMVLGRTPGEAFEILVNLQDVCVKELTIQLSVPEFRSSMVEAAHHDWIRGGRPFGAHSWPAERDALYAEINARNEFI